MNDIDRIEKISSECGFMKRDIKITKTRNDKWFFRIEIVWCGKWKAVEFSEDITIEQLAEVFRMIANALNNK
jgi:hypothetical protein